MILALTKRGTLVFVCLVSQEVTGHSPGWMEKPRNDLSSSKRTLDWVHGSHSSQNRPLSPQSQVTAKCGVLCGVFESLNYAGPSWLRNAGMSSFEAGYERKARHVSRPTIIFLTLLRWDVVDKQESGLGRPCMVIPR